uniref:Uncharacterized protein n=1 Tax=Panagrolaimus davidi TaxID=227884 RepID=A0A914PKS7_9BILA
MENKNYKLKSEYENQLNMLEKSIKDTKTDVIGLKTENELIKTKRDEMMNEKIKLQQKFDKMESDYKILEKSMKGLSIFEPFVYDNTVNAVKNLFFPTL